MFPNSAFRSGQAHARSAGKRPASRSSRSLNPGVCQHLAGVADSFTRPWRVGRGGLKGMEGDTEGGQRVMQLGDLRSGDLSLRLVLLVGLNELLGLLLDLLGVLRRGGGGGAARPGGGGGGGGGGRALGQAAPR